MCECSEISIKFRVRSYNSNYKPMQMKWMFGPLATALNLFYLSTSSMFAYYEISSINTSAFCKLHYRLTLLWGTNPTEEEGLNSDRTLEHYARA